MNPNEIRKLKEKAPFPIFILVVLMFLPSFLIQPEQEKLEETISAYDSLLKNGKAALVKRVSFAAEDNRMRKLTEVQQSVLQQLPEEKQLPEIIDRMNAVARQNSVLVKDVTYSFQGKMGKLQIPCFNISMNFSAYYEDMRRFVVALENLDYPLLVEEIVVPEGGKFRITLKQLVK
jgi:Tfp pilus assembly protein PilO